MNELERFHTKYVWDARTDCMLGPYAYWRFKRSDGTVVKAHRFSYETFTGPIPAGLELDHTCNRNCCINPDHLEAVTHAENMRRRSERQTACRGGHRFDEANTYITAQGYRQCRVCDRDRHRSKYQERPNVRRNRRDIGTSRIR